MLPLVRCHTGIEQPGTRVSEGDRAATAGVQRGGINLSASDKYTSSSTVGTVARLHGRDILRGNRCRPPEVCGSEQGNLQAVSDGQGWVIGKPSEQEISTNFLFLGEISQLHLGGQPGVFNDTLVGARGRRELGARGGVRVQRRCIRVHPVVHDVHCGHGRGIGHAWWLVAGRCLASGCV